MGISVEGGAKGPESECLNQTRAIELGSPGRKSSKGLISSNKRHGLRVRRGPIRGLSAGRWSGCNIAVNQ